MEEHIDVYDADLRPLGTKERTAAHLEGCWHRTFHCWVVRTVDCPGLLFQVRSPEMANFPNLLDVSAAGHLSAGEAVVDGLREVREELGIEFDPADTVFAGERVEVADQENGQHNREYQSVYFVGTELDLEDFTPQVEEVSGLLWLPLEDGLRLFTGAVSRVSVSQRRFTDGHWILGARELTSADFLPRIQKYYLAALIMSERLVEGRLPLAIS